ncbi:ligand-gated channel [Xanthomonas oryzae pv. oryzicola]|uniref:TonB-dependent siderophore receptor n=1 Tax=Xanthomonas oryzae TaxID=347 RepID=UPI000655C1E0|nr:TonB-dependent receptor [Xanthomonas oryzae]AKN93959.1 ligand-gated channel [Xanthomonas oryzae pv. oryzicola]
MRPTLLVTALALHTLPAFAQQTTAPAVTELDGVDVVGRAQTLYKSEDAAVATRTDTPLALVPQSVQVLPRELIDDQAARQITDLYRSISGISFFSYAGVTLRGFRQENVLYDGLRSDPYAGFSVPQLFNIEQYRFAPSSTWNVDMALRWFKNDEHQIYHEPMGLIDRNRDGTAEWMTRQLRNQYRDNDAISSNVNAVFRTSTGTIEHKLLMGADCYRLDANFRTQTANTADTGRVRGPVPGIDLFNPVYGRSGFYDYGLDSLPWRATSTRSQRYGTYLQDELTLTSRWYAMAGLRWDGFKDDNLLDGSRVTGNDLSWRVGSTVVLREGINAYASYASGFLPQDAANQDSSAGGPFAPERSTQWEVGLKTALNDGGLTFNTALYRIERSNIVQANGRIVDGVNQLSALGLVRSEGLEVDVLADLTERWVLNLTYAYNDARVLDAGTNGITNASGNRFANAPRNTFGLWTRYDLPAWRSAIAFGADYVGERVSLDGQRVKPYAIYDISWQTHWDAWKLQINIKNLFDKVYAVSGFNTRAGHFPGEPRRIYAQLAYRF